MKSRSPCCRHRLWTAGLATLAAVAATPASPAGLDASLGDLVLETGHFSRSSAPDTGFWLRASPSVTWRPAPAVEFRAGAQLAIDHEDSEPGSTRREQAILGETYVRVRLGQTRLTAGLQRILWGRVDEVPLADRVSRVDASRLLLDDLPNRRLPSAALRFEQDFDTLKVDVVVLPQFTGANLAAPRGVWSPVDQTRGALLGIEAPPSLSAFIRSARLRSDDDGSGGAALRLTQTGASPIDWGVTVARTRQSLPYYVADIAANTLTATHPYVRFAGAEMEFAADEATWRSEFGVAWDVRATTPSGQVLRTRSLDWIGAVEFFPGGEDTRVTLQLVARELSTRADILELRRYAALAGEVETSLDRGRWKLAMRFNSGLNVHDTYLAPEVTFAGWEPHQIYLGYHHFNGESRTLGGFHKDHDLLTLGLRIRF